MLLARELRHLSEGSLAIAMDEEDAFRGNSSALSLRPVGARVIPATGRTLAPRPYGQPALARSS